MPDMRSPGFVIAVLLAPKRNGEFCRVEPPFNEVTTILRCVQAQCRSARNHRKERTSVLTVSKNEGTQGRAL